MSLNPISSTASALKRPQLPESEESSNKRVCAIAQNSLSASARAEGLPGVAGGSLLGALRRIDSYTGSHHLQAIYHGDAPSEGAKRMKAEKMLAEFGIYCDETPAHKKTTCLGLERAIFPGGYGKEPQFGLILAVLNHEDMRKMLHQELIIEIFDWIERLHGKARDLSPIMSLLLAKIPLPPLTLQRLWERAKEKKNDCTLIGLFKITPPPKRNLEWRTDAMHAAHREKDFAFMKELIRLPAASKEELGLALWGAAAIGDSEFINSQILNPATISRTDLEKAALQAVRAERLDIAKSLLPHFPSGFTSREGRGEALVALLESKQLKHAQYFLEREMIITQECRGKAAIAAIKNGFFDAGVMLVGDDKPISLEDRKEALQLVLTAPNLHPVLLKQLLVGYWPPLQLSLFATSFANAVESHRPELFNLILELFCEFVRNTGSDEFRKICSTALAEAAKQGNTAAISLLFSRKFISYISIEDCEPIVSQALAGGHEETAKLLALNNPNTLLRIKGGMEIEKASSIGDLQKVKDILLDLCTRTTEVISKYARARAVVIAAEAGHFDIADYLFSDYKITSHLQLEKILRAASEQNNLKMVTRICESDAVIYNLDYSLLVATRRGHLRIVQKILESRGSNNIDCGDWSLVEACSRGRLDIVTEILKALDYHYSRTGYGINYVSAISAAPKNCRLSIAEKVLKKDKVLKDPLFINDCFFEAAKIQDEELADLILNTCDPISKNTFIQTVITSTIEQGGTLEAVKLLFRKMDSISDDFYLSAAMQAATKGEREIVNFLFKEYYPRSELFENDVIVAAAKSGHFEIVAELPHVHQMLFRSPEMIYHAARTGQVELVERILDMVPLSVQSAPTYASILHTALSYSQIHVVHLLSKRGVIQPAVLQEARNTILDRYEKLPRSEVLRYLSPGIPTEDFLYTEIRYLLLPGFAQRNA